MLSWKSAVLHMQALPGGLDLQENITSFCEITVISILCQILFVHVKFLPCRACNGDSQVKNSGTNNDLFPTS